jgi:hypothetical protein
MELIDSNNGDDGDTASIHVRKKRCRVGLDEYSHSTEQKDHNQTNLGGKSHPQTKEDPEGNNKNKEIGNDGDACCQDVEQGRVDLARPRHRKLPVCVNGECLENDNDEDGNHLEEIEDVEAVDGVSDTSLVTTESEQKDEDRRLDEGEDRIVKDLHDPVPEQDGLDIVCFG